MLRSLFVASSAIAIALAAQDASAASQSCTSTRCTATITDSSSGWVRFTINSTYVSATVYFNGGNSARTCYVYPSDPNFERVASVFAAAAAAPASSYSATFTMDFASGSSTCSSASITWWR